jgi:hypothetical protein
MKTRLSPVHDLESTLSNRSHGVLDLAGKSPLRYKTGLRLKDRRGPDFRIRGSRYYGTYLRKVERVGLGYGTRLSGYTTLDPAEDKYASPKLVPRRSDPSFL